MPPAPLELLIRRQPRLQIRQPDLSYLRNAKAGSRIEAEIGRVRTDPLIPSLAVEVLSRGQNLRTMAAKLSDDASVEVDEVWLDAAESRSIQVMVRNVLEYRILGLFAVGDRLESSVLPGIALDVAVLFPF